MLLTCSRPRGAYGHVTCSMSHATPPPFLVFTAKSVRRCAVSASLTCCRFAFLAGSARWLTLAPEGLAVCAQQAETGTATKNQAPPQDGATSSAAGSSQSTEEDSAGRAQNGAESSSGGSADNANGKAASGSASAQQAAQDAARRAGEAASQAQERIASAAKWSAETMRAVADEMFKGRGGTGGAETSESQKAGVCLFSICNSLRLQRHVGAGAPGFRLSELGWLMSLRCANRPRSYRNALSTLIRRRFSAYRDKRQHRNRWA